MKLIPEELQQALINYLEMRPYKEVEQGVIALKSLQDAPEYGEKDETQNTV